MAIQVKGDRPWVVRYHWEATAQGVRTLQGDHLPTGEPSTAIIL